MGSTPAVRGNHSLNAWSLDSLPGHPYPRVGQFRSKAGVGHDPSHSAASRRRDPCRPGIDGARSERLRQHPCSGQARPDPAPADERTRERVQGTRAVRRCVHAARPPALPLRRRHQEPGRRVRHHDAGRPRLPNGVRRRRPQHRAGSRGPAHRHRREHRGPHAAGRKLRLRLGRRSQPLALPERGALPAAHPGRDPIDSAKIGFCMYDTWPASVTGAPRYYPPRTGTTPDLVQPEAAGRELHPRGHLPALGRPVRGADLVAVGRDRRRDPGYLPTPGHRQPVRLRR